MEEILTYQKVSPDDFGAGSTTPPRKRASPRTLSINSGSDPRQPASRDHGIDRPPGQTVGLKPPRGGAPTRLFRRQRPADMAIAPADGATRFDSATSEGRVSCSAVKTAYGLPATRPPTGRVRTTTRMSGKSNVPESASRESQTPILDNFGESWFYTEKKIRWSGHGKVGNPEAW